MTQTPNFASLYRDHLEHLNLWLTDALQRAEAAGKPLDGVLFHSGRTQTYHRDDEEIRFRASAHFRRWVPAQDGPDHVIAVRPGERPVVVRVQPDDYWYDTTPPEPSHWEDAVDLRQVARFDQVHDALGAALGATVASAFAYVGSSPEAAAQWNIEPELVEPSELMCPLDWHRATKTPYEIEWTRSACRAAARGHLAARERFLAGDDERSIHRRYLEAADRMEFEMPYGNIVAFDDKSAILHYQHKRGPLDVAARNFLLDAGASQCGYASDITRTWATAEAHPVFRQLIQEVDATEQHLVSMVAPGQSYTEIHLEAHRRAAETLTRLGILHCSAEEALEQRHTRAFFPHGVGHLLGLQVHDVGGHQSSPEGGTTPPPDEHVLRNTRPIEVGHLVTVEPGIYFIPLLLEPLRQGPTAGAFDWQLIDQLIPLGGVRIEDNIVCTREGFEDLTRDLIEGQSSV